jgi:hypothetical protein
VSDTIHTASGSIYELRTNDKLIRRISGVNSPTMYQGPDGEWRRYEKLTGPEVGYPMIIVWAYHEELENEKTETSPVAAVFNNWLPAIVDSACDQDTIVPS